MTRLEDADALPFQAQELTDLLNRTAELGFVVEFADDSSIRISDGDREVIVEQDRLGGGTWDYTETEDR